MLTYVHSGVRARIGSIGPRIIIILAGPGAFPGTGDRADIPWQT